MSTPPVQGASLIVMESYSVLSLSCHNRDLSSYHFTVSHFQSCTHIAKLMPPKRSLCSILYSMRTPRLDSLLSISPHMVVELKGMHPDSRKSISSSSQSTSFIWSTFLSNYNGSRCLQRRKFSCLYVLYLNYKYLTFKARMQLRSSTWVMIWHSHASLLYSATAWAWLQRITTLLNLCSLSIFCCRAMFWPLDAHWGH